MEVLSFFYNVITTSLFFLYVVIFYLLYMKTNSKLSGAMAILFVTYTLDNLFLYAGEFLPSFAPYYQQFVSITPVIPRCSVVLVCLGYRLVILACQERTISKSECLIWAGLLILQGVASMYYGIPTWRIISELLNSFVAPGLFLFALCQLEQNSTQYPSWYVPGLIALLVMEVGASVEVLLGRLGGFAPLGDRIIFIELLSIFVTVSAGILASQWLRDALTPPAPIIVMAAPEVQEDESARLKRFISHYELTLREAEILAYLIAGDGNATISSKACIAPGTVKTHIHNIYSKVNVRNRVSLLTAFKQFS